MKALVVYESMFGNTAEVARSIAQTLAATMDVELCDVNDTPADPASSHDLIVAGGPTHAFSMSRTATRTDAVSQGAEGGKVDFGLREWLNRIPANSQASSLATFDTRVTKVRHLPGSAARSAAKVGRKHGLATCAAPESFYVEDVNGPLLEGEAERASEWARSLSTLVHAG